MNDEAKTAFPLIAVLTGLSISGVIPIIIILFILLIVPVMIITTFTSSEAEPSEYTDMNKKLGFMSAKYESSGDPGVIANNAGDIGGKSYGAFQFASNMGSLNGFLNWLKANDEDLYKRLISAMKKDNGLYGENFDNEWKKIAQEDSSHFYDLQHDYMKEFYYDVVADHFKKNKKININERSRALREAVWSTSVQHGPYGAINIMEKLNLNDADRKIITDLYNERMKVGIYFGSNSKSIQASVKNRLENELQEVLALLDEEENPLSEMTWPIPGFKTITSRFGWRVHPIDGNRKFHSGIDIGADLGVNIVTVSSGEVISTPYDVQGYGYYLIIDHGNGIKTLYGHCSEVIVSVGDKVAKGETIAKAGSTGKSTNNHLHFEVRKDDDAVNPLDYVDSD